MCPTESTIVMCIHVYFQGSAPVDPSPTPQTSILELDVLGFRVWMIIGFVGIGFLIISKSIAKYYFKGHHLIDYIL